MPHKQFISTIKLKLIIHITCKFGSCIFSPLSFHLCKKMAKKTEYHVNCLWKEDLYNLINSKKKFLGDVFIFCKC